MRRTHPGPACRRDRLQLAAEAAPTLAHVVEAAPCGHRGGRCRDRRADAVVGHLDAQGAVGLVVDHAHAQLRRPGMLDGVVQRLLDDAQDMEHGARGEPAAGARVDIPAEAKAGGGEPRLEAIAQVGERCGEAFRRRATSSSLPGI
jgi:hypothetical protein